MLTYCDYKLTMAMRSFVTHSPRGQCYKQYCGNLPVYFLFLFQGIIFLNKLIYFNSMVKQSLCVVKKMLW